MYSRLLLSQQTSIVGLGNASQTAQKDTIKSGIGLIRAVLVQCLYTYPALGAPFRRSVLYLCNGSARQAKYSIQQRNYPVRPKYISRLPKVLGKLRALIAASLSLAVETPSPSIYCPSSITDGNPRNAFFPIKVIDLASSFQKRRSKQSKQASRDRLYTIMLSINAFANSLYPASRRILSIIYQVYTRAFLYPITATLYCSYPRQDIIVSLYRSDLATRN